MKKKEIFFETIKSELPFAISTTTAGGSLLISLLFADIGPGAVAAGPFITALQNFCVGICRASLSATCLLIGAYNGSAKQKTHLACDSNQISGEYKKIGNVMRNGWAYSTILSAASVSILLLSRYIFRLVGISSEIAKDTQTYFNWYVLGVWPLLISYVDQQLPVGVKSPWVPLVRGPLYGLAVYVFSYIASQGYMGKYFEGMRGVGFGSAIAGWFILLFTKLAQIYKSNRKYSLYKFECITNASNNIFRSLTFLGSKLGFQVACEWLNLVGTALIIGRLGESAVRAIQPSVQVMTMIGLYSLGFSAGIGAVLTGNMGEFNTASENEHSKLNRNFINRGNFGILSGMIIPFVMGAIACIHPRVFTESLLNKDASSDELVLSNTIMRVNSFAIMFDSLRLIGAGPLRSFRDVNYTTAVSFFTMSVLGLFIEGMSVLKGDLSLKTFFWIRNITFFIPAMLVLHRWYTYLKCTVDKKLAIANLHMKSGMNLSTIFTPLRVVKKQKDNETNPLLDPTSSSNIKQVN